MKTTILQLPQMEEINEKLDVLLAVEETKADMPKDKFDLVSSKRLSLKLDLTEQTLSNYAKKGYFEKYRFERKIFYSMSEVEQAIKSKHI